MQKIEIIHNIKNKCSFSERQIVATLGLLDEGCTIPFISRYRKEKTGNLSEVDIALIQKLYSEKEQLEKRREYILKYLKDEGLLTASLESMLKKAMTNSELEDIYLPYKPHKKNLAEKAIDLGMKPLADLILAENLDLNSAKKMSVKFLNENVRSENDAIEHAVNILTQNVTENTEVRKYIRSELQQGKICCKIKRGKKDLGTKYKDYFDYNEDLSKVAAHRGMAILRACNEGILNLGVETKNSEDKVSLKMQKLAFNKKGELLSQATTKSYKKYLNKSIGNEILAELKEKAESESLTIFQKNLEKIILSAPFGEKSVIGVDPGIRTGCKCVAIDANGNFLDYQAINLAVNPGDVVKLKPWLKKYDIKGIAIGSGTFSKESYNLIKKCFADNNVIVTLVDEDGASIYSASKEARDEFPDLDVTVRGAISIARRFQDPMAELIKIDPQSLGIGQYQHDITPSLLQEGLNQTINWAVNRVGVNLNTAGYQLLSHISGLDKKRAKAIVDYRRDHNGIKNRQELLKVPGIGVRSFEQAAGFLRIANGDNPLDATGVHPESYSFVKNIAKDLKTPVAQLIGESLDDNQLIVKNYADVENFSSVLEELAKKNLDPRDEFSVLEYNTSINSIDDLQVGMVLNGQVDNITGFGAFVDFGLKEKGLVHISEISDSYIEDISKVLAVGDRLKVKIINIDKERSRISLSAKNI